ncbi:TIR domain-containing protein [Heliobacterium mobile]|uniref:TIR domain-containing protein n=1 Tax=Heliobacterium mobile TaxID=28064 RepID=UPI0014797E8B|nr:TIR domain-containing protein [Heliobacterium mobile]
MREIIDFRYDAFISYRHTQPDKRIAEQLHTALETYKVPRILVEKGVPRRLERVFRDRDELPTTNNLSDSIREALHQSRFLIVICSPRTPQSDWIAREIQIFMELGREKQILALLIEGEPAESFPKQLCNIERTFIDDNGAVNRTSVEIEPLAADIRATSFRKSMALLKTEKLRLIAPIIGCTFDDLKQRHRERQIRQWEITAASVMALLLLFGLYSYRQWQYTDNLRIEAEKARENEREARMMAEQALSESERAKLQEMLMRKHAEDAEGKEKEARLTAEEAREKEQASRILADEQKVEALLQKSIADSEKERAEFQKNLALDRINQLTFDIPDRLRRFPQVSPIVTEILDANIKTLDQLIDRNEDDIIAKLERVANYERLGERWLHLNELNKSVECFQNSIDLLGGLADAEDPPVRAQVRQLNGILYRQLGEAYMAIDHISEAREALIKSEENFKAIGDYENIGQLYVSATTFFLLDGDPSQALHAAQLAFDANPEEDVAILNLGVAYLFTNQFDLAKDIFIKHKDRKVKRLLTLSADGGTKYFEDEYFGGIALETLNFFVSRNINHPDLPRLKHLITSMPYQNPSEPIDFDALIVRPTDRFDGILRKAYLLRREGRIYESLGALSRCEQMVSDDFKPYIKASELFTAQIETLGVDGGIFVSELVEGGIAEKSGIRVNDIIIGYDGKAVTNDEDLLSAIQATPEERSVNVQCLRSAGIDRFDIVSVTISEVKGRLGILFQPI